MRYLAVSKVWGAALMVCVCAMMTMTMMVACAKPRQPQMAPPHTKAMKPAPATPIDTKKIELGGTTWDPHWDVLVEQALPPEMLSRQVPHDVRRFCPRFYQMQNADKRAFWAYFFQALAGAEAGLDPTANVHHTEPVMEKRDAVTHARARTEGLLQLAYEDADRYGCDFDWKRDRMLKQDDPARTILQPKNNLDCGVRILDNQIITQRKPLLSESGYWSTLRRGTASYRVFAKQMTNPPLACGLGEKTGRKRGHHTPNQTRQSVAAKGRIRPRAG